MDDRKTEAIWSWDYNHRESFPWPCSKCGSLVKMEKIGNPTQRMYIKCPKCGFNEGAVNSMENFACIHHIMHERGVKCGHIQEISLDRCLKRD